MPGSDLKLSESRTEGYRHFVNKIWNASRFALMNLEDLEPDQESLISTPSDLSLPDRWIRGRLNQAVRAVEKSIEEYKFNEASHHLYQFVWHEFCDWYLELIKPYLYQDKDVKQKRMTQMTLLRGLDDILRMLHPFMPFVTEEIWQRLPLKKENGSIMVTPFPKPEERFDDEEAEQEMGLVIEVITALRNIRGEMNIPPADQVEALLRVKGKEDKERLQRNHLFIQNLARVKSLRVLERVQKPPYSAFAVVRNVEIFVPMDRSKIEEEGKRLRKEISKIEKEIAFVGRKLSNEQFLSKAPPDVVQEEREKAAQYQALRGKLEENLKKIRETLAG
jgi:valyl-tRNA synthetase